MISKIKVNFTWKKLVALFLVLIFSAVGYVYYEWVNLVIPEELLPQVISKTLETDSYRYHVALKINISEQEKLLSEVKGQRGLNEFHLQGFIAGQEVDVIYVDDKVYMKDAVSDRWMVNQGRGIFDQDLFMVEVNPITCLEFVELNNINYLGMDKSKTTSYVMEYNPVVANKMLTTYWTDFEYKVWIHKGAKLINKVEIFAKHKDNPKNGLHMQLLLSDFNKKVKVEAPAMQ